MTADEFITSITIQILTENPEFARKLAYDWGYEDTKELVIDVLQNSTLVLNWLDMPPFKSKFKQIDSIIVETDGVERAAYIYQIGVKLVREIYDYRKDRSIWEFVEQQTIMVPKTTWVVKNG